MTKQKGFIKITLLIVIIIGVLVIGGISYIGVMQYQNYQTEQIKKRQETQINKEKQEAEIAELKNKLIELENKPAPKPQIIYNTIEKTTEKIINQPGEISLAEIVKKWSPKVVYIFCEWHSDDETNVIQGSGSGLLTSMTNGQVIISSNKHVYLYQNIYTATFCDMYLLNGEKYRVLTENFYSKKDGTDHAAFYLSNVSTYVKNLADDHSYCTKDPEIGDKIVILGYPGVGSSSGITATEGIISGYEGDYYVTSAKIEHGNSGGVAILIKDNCFVGIPTASVAGSLESLGRILSFKKIIN